MAANWDSRATVAIMMIPDIPVKKVKKFSFDSPIKQFIRMFLFVIFLKIIYLTTNPTRSLGITFKLA